MIDLKKLKADHPECFEDSDKFKAYLRDLYPAEKARINILVAMFSEGIAQIVIKDDEFAKSSFCAKIVSDFGFSSDLVSECYQLFVSIYEKTDIEKYLSLAKQGNAEAQYKIGNCYYLGNVVPRDYEEAVKWYRLSADQQFADALYALGYCYECGLGVAQNFDQARKFVTMAAILGNAQALYLKGLDCYEFFYEDENLRNSAIGYFKRAAEKGNLDAMCCLGDCCLWARKQDSALKYYQIAVTKGNDKAAYALGRFYLREKEVAQAIKWFIKSAESGFSRAQYQLGEIFYQKAEYEAAIKWYKLALEGCDEYIQKMIDIRYLEFWGSYSEQGKYVALSKRIMTEAQEKVGRSLFQLKKYSEAIKWATLAGDKQCVAQCGFAIVMNEYQLNPNSAETQCRLGLCYLKGEGVQKDCAKAVDLFQLSAQQGNAGAEYHLGLCFSSGYGVEINKEEAIKWYLRSARHGHADAQYEVGANYLSGKGLEYNYEEALKWLNLSAEQGNDKAQYQLGHLSYSKRGRGNNVVAAKWFRLSAENGNSRAAKTLADMYRKGEIDKVYQEKDDDEDIDVDFDDDLDIFDDLFDDDILTPASSEKLDEKKLAELTEAVYWYEKAIVNSSTYIAEEIVKGIKFCFRQVKRLFYVKSADSVLAGKVIPLIECIADKGLQEAQELMGDVYRYGLYVEKNESLAFEWYRRAVCPVNVSNDEEIAYKLGCRGKDSLNALRYYFGVKDERKGYSIKLGECYQFGIGTKCDIERAVKHYEYCIKQGDYKVEAECYLANIRLISNAHNSNLDNCERIVNGDFVVKGDNLYRYIGELENVVIPQGIAKIGEGAFAGNQTVRQITIPDCVTEVGESAFSACENLESISLGSGIKSLPRHCFMKCKKLSSVILSHALAEIRERAFAYCESLIEIDVYDSQIYDEAFAACKNLNRVKFGLGGHIKTCTAFYGCSSLQEIVFAGTEERWENRNGFGILFASCKMMPQLIYGNETLLQGEAAKETSIEALDFSVRTYNCLKRANIHYVKDLCDLQREDICKIRNIGQKGVDEVMKKMEELGLL